MKEKIERLKRGRDKERKNERERSPVLAPVLIPLLVLGCLRHCPGFVRVPFNRKISPCWSCFMLPIQIIYHVQFILLDLSGKVLEGFRVFAHVDPTLLSQPLAKSPCPLLILIHVLLLSCVVLISRSQNKNICPINCCSTSVWLLLNHILFFLRVCSCQQFLTDSGYLGLSVF